MRRASIGLALTGLLVGVFGIACSETESRQPSTGRRPAARVGHDDVPRARGIDVRHPQRIAPLTPAVLPVDVPSSAPSGVSITTTFEATPDASCQLRVTNGDRDVRVPQPHAVADRTGRVSWTWAAKAVAGDVLRALVVCSGGEHGSAEIVVESS